MLIVLFVLYFVPNLPRNPRSRSRLLRSWVPCHYWYCVMSFDVIIDIVWWVLMLLLILCGDFWCYCIWCAIKGRTFWIDRIRLLRLAKVRYDRVFFLEVRNFDEIRTWLQCLCSVYIYIFDKGVFCTNSFGMFSVCLLISADFPKSSSFGFKIEDETQKSQRLISIVYHKNEAV